MSDPKKHHFLPQSYLERFQTSTRTTKMPRIWVHSKVRETVIFSAAIHDTACISNYNTIDFRDREPERARIEGKLSKLEGIQKILLDRVLSENEVPEDCKKDIAFMVTLMHVRVPKFKRYIENFLKTSVLSLTESELRSGRVPPMPDALVGTGKTFRELIRVEISNWIVLDYMYNAALGGNFAAILNDMHFGLLIAPEGESFITCDSPVAIYYPQYENVKPYGVGLLFKEVELTFPLSPRVMLLATWDGRGKVKLIDQKEMTEYNRRTVVMADKYVYSDASRPSVVSLIAKNAEKSAGFVLDELSTQDSAKIIGRFIPITSE